MVGMAERMLHTIDTGDAEMKNGNGKACLFWIALSEAVGALSGVLSRGGIQAYSSQAVQPGFSPPPVVFPIVWSILYGLMGFGMARIRRGGGGKQAQNLFVAQLVVNFFWPLIFFNTQAFGFAFFWLLLLWVLAALMALAFYRQDNTAGLAQIPYLLWLTFAAVLNFFAWQLNG